MTCIVSLTFDDGLDVHLDVVMPMLEEHGFLGTFYVSIGSESFNQRWSDWTAAARRGHELGNHTIFHPGVSSKSWVTSGIALENYDLDRMRVELRTANRILHNIDGREHRSFAFPCSNPWLGRRGPIWRIAGRLPQGPRWQNWVSRLGIDVASGLVDYTTIVRDEFPAARCGGIDAAVLPARPADWHRIPALEGDGRSADDVMSDLEIAAARNAFAPLVFHGIGGGHRLSMARDDFGRLLAFLANDPRFTVLPLVTAAERAR